MNCKAFLFRASLFAVFLIAACQSPQRQKNATDDNNMLLGNPDNATHNINSADDFLIDHNYYTESYTGPKGSPIG